MTESRPASGDERAKAEAFISRWRQSAASERANYALFLVELRDMLGLDHPDPAIGEAERDGYVFERAVIFHNHDGTTSNGFIDLYRRGCFVLATKQGCAAKAAARPQIGPLRRRAMPMTRAMMKITRKMKNRVCAIPEAATETPPKPRNPAMIAMIKKTAAQ